MRVPSLFRFCMRVFNVTWRYVEFLAFYTYRKKALLGDDDSKVMQEGGGGQRMRMIGGAEAEKELRTLKQKKKTLWSSAVR